MVIDGRSELASPDLALARLLLRGGKPVFLAVNKMDTEALQPQAENFRRLGFRNVVAISAEHNIGIGDLLDDVFAVLPQAPEVAPPESFLTEQDEIDEDATGPDYSEPAGAELAYGEDGVILSAAKQSLCISSSLEPESPDRPRRLRSHGAFESHENQNRHHRPPQRPLANPPCSTPSPKSDRAIVSPIAGTTRDAVGRGRHPRPPRLPFRRHRRSIRRKGKTHLMAGR